ncbi:hypothetical protein [Candidatus Palauibacter sp.]|uniref:hypothetical protein n=1 Tax=Candidatus Palauibacter sp. TaxID=3101350 RepID=UPI003B0221BC
MREVLPLRIGVRLTTCLLYMAGSGLTAASGLAAETGLGVVQMPGLPVYEREVFTYSAFGRRDPFQPLGAAEQEGPRFADLALSGVLLNAAVGSVATLTDRRTGRRYRAREGDTVGEATVQRIDAEGVEFIVETFGVRRRETLQVRREGRGGG